MERDGKTKRKQENAKASETCVVQNEIRTDEA